MWAGAVLGQTFAQSGIRDAAEKSIPVSLSLRTKSRAMYWLESTAAIVSVLTGMLARSKNFSLIVLSACLLVIQTSIIMSQLSNAVSPSYPESVVRTASKTFLSPRSNWLRLVACAFSCFPYRFGRFSIAIAGLVFASASLQRPATGRAPPISDSSSRQRPGE